MAAPTREPAITQDQGMEGIQLSEAITGDGVAIFRHACWMVLEGISLEAHRLAVRQRADTCMAEDEEPEF